MKKLSPILWTRDLEATISFYHTVLGFSGQSNFPGFVSLTRGDVEIMFIVPQEVPADPGSPATAAPFFPEPILTGSLFIVTGQVNELWDTIKDKAVIKSAIADRAYRMRDFSILDNNGYELVFGQDISSTGEKHQ